MHMRPEAQKPIQFSAGSGVSSFARTCPSFVAKQIPQALGIVGLSRRRYSSLSITLATNSPDGECGCCRALTITILIYQGGAKLELSRSTGLDSDTGSKPEVSPPNDFIHTFLYRDALSSDKLQMYIPVRSLPTHSLLVPVLAPRNLPPCALDLTPEV